MDTDGKISAEDIRRVTFPETRSRELGLDADKVHAYLNLVADTIETYEAEMAKLRRRIIDPANQARVHQAVNLLTRAQQVADEVVAEAQAFAGQVTGEARAAYDTARHRANAMIEELQRFVAEAGHRITDAYSSTRSSDQPIGVPTQQTFRPQSEQPARRA